MPNPKAGIFNLFRERGSSTALILLGIAAVAVVGGYLLVNGRSQGNNKPPETAKPEVASETKPEPAKTLPDSIYSLLTDNDINQLEKGGMTIYKGKNPPNIEGNYLFDALVVTYDSELDVVGREVTTDEYDYFGQRDGKIKIMYDGDDSSITDGFISGDGQCFTLASQPKYQSVTVKSCDYEGIEVTSACRIVGGLEKVQRAAYLRTKQGDDCDKLIPINGLRIVREQDNLAEQLD